MVGGVRVQATSAGMVPWCFKCRPDACGQNLQRMLLVVGEKRGLYVVMGVGVGWGEYFVFVLCHDAWPLRCSVLVVMAAAVETWSAVCTFLGT